MGASVVPHCDAPPIFEFCEEVFHLVAFLVGGFAVFDLDFAVLLWRDAGCNILL